MRTVIGLSLAVLTLSAATLSAASCSKAPDPVTNTVAASASASGSAPAAAPKEATVNAAARSDIGGQIVGVGEHQVELRLFANGLADAVVRDAKGAFLDEKSKARLSINANAAANAHPRIELAFEPAFGRFAANGAAKVALAPGPVDLELHLGDAVSKGHLEAPVLLVGPQLGGTLVVAGKNGVELDARVDGRVEALVHDAAGAPINGGAALDVEVNLAGADGQAHAVKLAWDDAKARFAVQVDAAVKLAGGPADILLNGEIAAHVPAFALRTDPKHGGRVIIVGEYSVELVTKGHAVSAFVADLSGAAVTQADLALSLRAGAGKLIKLAWDAPSHGYRAKVAGALNLDTAPITLGIRADGKAFVGGLIPSVNIDAAASGKLDSKAKASANVKIPRIQVSKSASASAGNAGVSAKAGFSLGSK